MSVFGKESVRGGVALVVVLIGCWWTVQAWVRWPATRARLTRKQESVAHLYALQEQRAGQKNVWEVLDALPDSRPFDIERRAREVMPGVVTTVRPRDRVELARGWRLRRQDVSLQGVSAALLGHWLYVLEEHRPPWRVLELELQADPASPGAVQVELRVEGLEQQ